jgi:hypothetical protein
MDPADLSESSMNVNTHNLIPKDRNFQRRFWEWTGRRKVRKRRRQLETDIIHNYYFRTAYQLLSL